MAGLAAIRHLADRRLWRFMAVGIIAFTLEYSLFIGLFTLAKLPLLAAHSLSFCGGLITSFLLNRQWTFNHAQFKRGRVSQFGLYLALALFNLAATNIILHSLEATGLNPYAGKVLVIALIATWNYLLYGYAVFPKRPS
jgi:putative flippase GtrA